MYNKLIGTLAALLMTGTVGAANAATLTGTQISGSLVFADFASLGSCFDPNNFSNCTASAAPASTIPFRQTGAGVSQVLEGDDTYPTFVTGATSPPEFLFDDVGFLVVSVDVDATTVSINIEDTLNLVPPEDALAPYAWDIHLTLPDQSALLIESAVLIIDLFPGLTATIDDDGKGILFHYAGRRDNGLPGEDPNARSVWIENGSFSATYELVVTPLPATLPLFLSGLGGFGLFGWWRRRRAGSRAFGEELR